MSDPKLDSPSFHRNIDPIVTLFRELMIEPALTWLEIGSGSGQHVERFAREFPDYTFQPTDIEQENLASISAWTKGSMLTNVREPLLLDVTADKLPFKSNTQFDIISAFNVIHISPWSVTEGIFQRTAAFGSDHCRIFLYGPFKIDGEQTSESNATFEEWLKGKSDKFGIRDIDDVNAVAIANGFSLKEKHSMPANNFMMEFARVIRRA